MGRVTEATVRLVAGSIPATTSIATELSAANVLVDAHLLTVGHSEALLIQIELYVAAHLAVLKVPEANLSSRGGDGSSTGIGGDFGLGLQGTRFGQTALLLDTSGTLAQVNRSAAGASPAVGGVARMAAL